VPQGKGQNEEGGPHHSLHRVLHSRESCSTVTDEIVRIQYLLPHELAVEFRRATGSGLDLVQKFPQIHFSYPPWADGPNCAPSCLASH